MAINSFTATSYPSCNDPLGTNITSYTMMGWWYFTSAGSSDQCLFSRGRIDRDDSATYAYMSATRTLIFGELSAGSLASAAITSLVGSWYHVAFVRSEVSPRRQIFVNGVSVASQVSPAAYPGLHDRQFATGVMLRATETSRRQCTYGTAFDSRVYARPVPVTEIAHIVACRGKDNPTDALIRWCIQDGPSGQSMTGRSVADHSVNGNHGVVQGTDLVSAQEPYGTVRASTRGLS